MAEKEDHLEIPARDYSGWRNFPEGLRVLVFDEDLEYLRLMENFLQEFQYEVTTCNEEERAMYLLRNHINRFDIAIMEVNNPDGDRFRLISEIGSEMDLPIILISKDDSVESVTNWMSTSACDYLIKPIRPEDLRLIFKHVVKKLPGKRCVVTGEAEEKSAGEKSSSVGCSTKRNPNKRKRSICLDAEVNEEDHHDHDRACAPSSKKRRVVWDNELHKKFLDAVEYLGLENAVPKKILEIMNVEGISRENVASHLQKFRLSRKKQNDQIKREESNHYLITPQGRRIYVGEDASNFYRGTNVQFRTHQIDNIPQPSYVQPQYTTIPNNPTTQRISPWEHHYDGDSIRNQMMTSTHQHHHHHQTSDFTTEEISLGYNSFNEDESVVGSLLSTPNFEEVRFQESLIAAMGVPNDHHSSTFNERRDVHEVRPSPMLHFSSVSTSYTHSSFLDQQESGGCNNNSGYSIDNNKLT